MISDQELLNTLKDALHKELTLAPALHKAEKELNQILKELEKSLDPRTLFKQWRDSKDGKAWKLKTLKQQNHRCSQPNCQKKIYFKGSHIDHIQPISKRPDLATDPTNLRLLCPTCNTRKGTS